MATTFKNMMREVMNIEASLAGYQTEGSHEEAGR